MAIGSSEFDVERHPAPYADEEPPTAGGSSDHGKEEDAEAEEAKKLIEITLLGITNGRSEQQLAWGGR